MYVLDGLAGGALAAPRKMLDEDGDVMRLGQYWDDEGSRWTGMEKSPYADALGISAFPYDWDADGDLDLVLGSNEGGVYLRRNVGTAEEPRWSRTSERVAANGKPLQVPSGHAMPVVADWDGDGLGDLVSGSDDGDVWWWRNVGAAGAPEFAAEVKLVARTGEGLEELGERTQVAVADFDADGDLDLLVGDYHSAASEDPDAGRTWHGWVWLVRRGEAPARRP